MLAQRESWIARHEHHVIAETRQDIEHRLQSYAAVSALHSSLHFGTDPERSGGLGLRKLPHPARPAQYHSDLGRIQYTHAVRQRVRARSG
jgi:hypothetical protein